MKASLGLIQVYTLTARCRRGTVDDCRGRGLCRPRQVPGCLAVIEMLGRDGRFWRRPVRPGKNWDGPPSPAVGRDG
jgi:hypothetical protein